MAKRTCAFEGCMNTHAARGYCTGHYTQLQRGETLRPLAKRRKHAPQRSFKGCTNRPHSGDLCGGHLSQQWRGQELRPLARQARRGEPMTWLRTLASAPEDGQCHDWPFGAVDGYGVVSHDGKSTRVPRVMLLLTVGEAPTGDDCALHSCDRPICAAPWHLRWGSKADNAGDMSERGRVRRPRVRADRCVYGHRYTPENTLQTKIGRRCRTCRANRVQGTRHNAA